MLIHVVLFNHSDRTLSTSSKAIAPLQLPKQRSHPSNSPNSELLAAALRYRTPSNLPNSDRTPPTPQTAIPTERFAIAPLQLPKQRSHPLNSPNSDRTPSLPKQRSHSLNSPNSDRTPSTSQKRSHPINFQNSDSYGALRYRIPPTSQTAIALPQLPNSDSYGALRYRTPSTSQKRSHPLQLPNIPFLTNHEDAKNTKKEEKREQ
ncbi:MAG: hypothetical protein HEQ27_06890 [Dolichospermum sp. JUN01]|nr:hypothetical protein [Dolichospermum sp. JUN01]